MTYDPFWSPGARHQFMESLEGVIFSLLWNRWSLSAQLQREFFFFKNKNILMFGGYTEDTHEQVSPRNSLEL